MKLAQAVDFQQIIDSVFPAGSLPRQADLTLGDIISKLFPYVFVAAGLLLFGYLVMGGFELLTSGGNPEKVKSAQGKITSAIIGFLIIFVAYWLVQILEIIFGLELI